MDHLMNKGTLWLIPSMLGDTPADRVIPAYNIMVIGTLKIFIVEEIRTARRFLKKCIPEINIGELEFLVFNEHSDTVDLSPFIEPLMNGKDVGLLSEAGIPCIADPGSEIVKASHEHQIVVKPLTGPSSLFLALMASGFNGQNFAFHGYLPVDKKLRKKSLRELEKAIYANDQTQLFIETPYRNRQLVESILETCMDSTLLCIANLLTDNNEEIITRSIREWRKNIPDLNKKPSIFLLYR